MIVVRVTQIAEKLSKIALARYSALLYTKNVEER